ncbi:MAG TPA: CorA family divalent cation transporter [Alphaproteobacteria bacterium]|jgi:Mg2+ and Co2+ transporter CorA|nr:CorA family divalent cation transporter [Alphaproteobacteria bacterium]
MKKVFLSILVSSTFLFTPTFVHAEDAVKSPRPFVQKEKVSDLRKQIVTNFFNNMVERLQAAEDRLNKILERIESRVAKIKDQNPSKDLTKINNDIAFVKTKLAETQTKINTLKTDFEKMITSDSPKESFKNVKEEVQNTKRSLQEIRRELSQIIGEIKGLHVGESKNE